MTDDTPEISDVEVVEDMDVDLDGDGTTDGHVKIEVERIDVDGDGTTDIVVVTETTTVDMTGDGTVDGAEITEAVMMDLDGDGTADSVTITRTTVVDVDGDGIPDVAEVEEVDFSEIPERAAERRVATPRAASISATRSATTRWSSRTVGPSCAVRQQADELGVVPALVRRPAR